MRKFTARPWNGKRTRPRAFTLDSSFFDHPWAVGDGNYSGHLIIKAHTKNYLWKHLYQNGPHKMSAAFRNIPTLTK
jgi:hypothetical protein